MKYRMHIKGQFIIETGFKIYVLMKKYHGI